MNQQTIAPQPEPQYLTAPLVEAAPLWFICPSCRAVLSVPMDRAGMEGPCPTCNVRIRAPRSEEAHPIHEEPPGFAARKKIEAQSERPAEELREDEEMEERRRMRLEAEWRRSAEGAHSRRRSMGSKVQRFLDSAWPRVGAIAFFFASLIAAWKLLKG